MASRRRRQCGMDWSLVRRVLRQAGIRDDACEIILEGADSGAIAEPPRPDGKIHFSRSLPKEKAMDDVLLVWKMNGEPLTPAHGYPLRAIVPGWYAMASIKWLQRIIVTKERYDGYYQTIDYSRWERTDSGPVASRLRRCRSSRRLRDPKSMK